MTTAIRPLERLEERSEKNPTGPLFRDFVFTREADDAPGAPIRLAISSEAPVLRYDWRSGSLYYEVLDHSASAVDLSYVRDGIPFCLDHWLSKQIGLGENIRVEGDRKLRCDVIEGSHPDAEWTFKDIRNGVRKKVSVGYDPGDEYVETKNAGDEYPTRRYTRWMPYEVSSVTVPADYDVGIGRDARGVAKPLAPVPATEAAPSAHTGERTMSAENEAGAGAAAPAANAPNGPTREQQLANLAKKHNRASDLISWIAEGRTVEAVRDMLLDEASQRNAERPNVGNAAPKVEVGKDRAEDKPWNDGGEFFRSVITGTKAPHALDVRLLAGRSQNTQTGADGGFAVPPSVVTMLFESAKTGGELLSRVTMRPVTTGNGIKEVLIKEESRVNGSRNGGLRHYWVAQEGSITVSQAKTRELELNTKKIAAAVPVTEEQQDDGPALIAYLQEQVPDELRFGKELAIWSGSGAGTMYGFTNSGALISQAIEATQTIANTSEFIWKNAAKMMTRMNPSAFLRSVFFINPALWADIVTATAGAAANGATTLFTPPGRLEGMPFGAIYGRPIVPVEYCSAVGTVGDFVLADMSDYLMIQKGGLKTANSIHVEFLKENNYLRFTERVDGQPRTRVPLTPLNGSVTTSPYVALAARS